MNDHGTGNKAHLDRVDGRDHNGPRHNGDPDCGPIAGVAVLPSVRRQSEVRPEPSSVCVHERAALQDHNGTPEHGNTAPQGGKEEHRVMVSMALIQAVLMEFAK